MHGSCVYSTFDMRCSYHHIELSKESQPKSAFVTPMGKLEFPHILPFGMPQAPAYFQRLVNEEFTELDFPFRYLDDILVLRLDIKMHLECFNILFKRLQKVDLKLKETSVIF